MKETKHKNTRNKHQLAGCGILISVLILLMLLVGGHMVLSHGISVGQFVEFNTYMILLIWPIIAVGWVVNLFQRGTASIARIDELLKAEPAIDDSAADPAIPAGTTLRGEIEFRHVNFAYPTGEAVLQDISFKVKPGQTVAIVGQTGTGKTSLMRLVNRTYDTSGGQILVDGVDVRDWNLASLRSQISIIEQDIFLFSRSIAENIAFGKPDATRQQVEAAAQSAQVDDFIHEFEKGYDTVIGERGVTLSGGQRQRLAIARAFLTDPRILILDDSTSAIDSATEDKIQRAIAAAARGRTTLIITHRLSQIRWADLIIVLRKGHIAAIGNHDELMKTSDAYARIFRE